MSARRIGWTLGGATLAVSGAYVFIYLYRWEWNRALTAGVFFLAAEIGLAVVFLAERIRKLETRLDREPTRDDAVHEKVRSRLDESAPPPRDHFAWMRASAQRTNVFIPVLMGAGVILSAAAWLVERLARATARPALADKLAARLLPITLPADPIVADSGPADSQGLDLLRRPGAGGGR